MPNHSRLSFGFGHPKSHTTSLSETRTITSVSFDGMVCATTSSTVQRTSGSVTSGSTSNSSSDGSCQANCKKDSPDA